IIVRPPWNAWLAADSPDRRGSTPIVLGGIGIVALAALAFFFLFGGREGHVSGRVTLEDEAVGLAQVMFYPEAGEQSPFVAMTNDAGDYVLSGHNGPGIPTGK